MKKRVFLIIAIGIFFSGCPRCLPPAVFSGNAIVNGEVRKATLTWDQSWNTVLIQVPQTVRTEYAIRHAFSFKAEDFTITKVQITPQLEVFQYTAELKSPQRIIYLSIIQQPKNGDSRWPCHHAMDDEVFVVHIQSLITQESTQKNFRFLSRNVTARETNPLNGIRYKFFPCP